MRKFLLLALACGMLWSCKKSEAPSVAVLTTTSLTNVTANSVQSGGTITNSGGSNITQKGICWALHSGPSLSDSFTNSGTGSSSFTTTISNLNANTMYYFRAYAINGTGTGYGAEMSVATSKGTPTVTTTAVSGVDQKAATAASGGSITNDGGASVTARGICWSTSHNPTTANSKTSDSTGTGAFTSTMSLLLSQTTYYVRAYATNSYGTAYGNELSITTPSVNTVADADGNVYPYVVIGNQTWMGANLKTAHYGNGDAITDGSASSYLGWYTTTIGAYTYPNDSIQYNSTYGKYYGVAAVQDSRNICPIGWHVPTNGEWETLEFYLGMAATDTGTTGLRGTIGSKLLIGGTSGLNLQLGGYLLPTAGGGSYLKFGSFGVYLSSTIVNTGVSNGGPNPNYFRAFNVSGTGPIFATYAPYSCSIRCVKN